MVGADSHPFDTGPGDLDGISRFGVLERLRQRLSYPTIHLEGAGGRIDGLRETIPLGPDGV